MFTIRSLLMIHLVSPSIFCPVDVKLIIAFHTKTAAIIPHSFITCRPIKGLFFISYTWNVQVKLDLQASKGPCKKYVTPKTAIFEEYLISLKKSVKIDLIFGFWLKFRPTEF